MKSVVRIMSIALASLFVLASCNKDKVDYAQQGNETKENIGYLSLAKMEASVMEDTENIESSTRAEGVDVNDFDAVRLVPRLHLSSMASAPLMLLSWRLAFTPSL